MKIKYAGYVGDDIGIIQTLVLFVIVAFVAYIIVSRQIQRVSTQETAQEAQRETQATSQH